IAEMPQLRVQTIVGTEKNRPISVWTISVEGLAGSIPGRVHFPRLPKISRQEKEMLAVPVWLGQQTADARKLLSSPDHAQRFEYPYPGQLSLQCLAFYQQDGPGLYLSCDDAAVFRKAFAFFGDGRGNIGCDFVHVPQHSNVSEHRWELPYHAVIGTFTG